MPSYYCKRIKQKDAVKDLYARSEEFSAKARAICKHELKVQHGQDSDEFIDVFYPETHTEGNWIADEQNVT